VDLSKARLHDLSSRPFRANPDYELVLFDRLPAEERRVLAGLEQDPELYGVLRPLGAPRPGLGLKSVDRETALLFLTLREPGPLPAYVRSAFGESAARAIARLVADGVLEVEHGGAFLSGAAALDRLRSGAAGPAGPAGEAVPGRLAELSAAALRHGQALALDDPLALSYRLYGFHRRPLTPCWKRLLPSTEAVRDYLGIGPGGAARRALRAGWTEQPAARSAGWLSWQAGFSGGDGGLPAASAPTFKLYVSPAPEALPGCFAAVVEGLAAKRSGGAWQLKVGSDAAGLLRPDKMVAYFPSFESLAEAAGLLAPRLAGIPAHGVPFTAEAGGDGLLSWGVDPPAAESPLPGAGRESWRLWLTHRLARALLAARAARAVHSTTVEPWQLALERLRLEGVSTETWTPGAWLWRQS
jgi:hypothetical protein